MDINQKFEYVDGSFDTIQGELVCVKHEKYGSVQLCFKENMYLPFATIKLHSKDLFVDAMEVIDDAYKLGNEICRRWNECNDKK